jgi:hypothetical protein
MGLDGFRVPVGGGWEVAFAVFSEPGPGPLPPGPTPPNPNPPGPGPIPPEPSPPDPIPPIPGIIPKGKGTRWGMG